MSTVVCLHRHGNSSLRSQPLAAIPSAAPTCSPVPDSCPAVPPLTRCASDVLLFNPCVRCPLARRSQTHEKEISTYLYPRVTAPLKLLLCGCTSFAAVRGSQVGARVSERGRAMEVEDEARYSDLHIKLQSTFAHRAVCPCLQRRQPASGSLFETPRCLLPVSRH